MIKKNKKVSFVIKKIPIKKIILSSLFQILKK